LSTAHCPPSKLHYDRFPVFWVLGAFAGLFACTAMVFAVRRLSGALVNPLSAVVLISSGFLGGISAIGIRSLWQGTVPIFVSTKMGLSPLRRSKSRSDLIVNILLSASLLVFGLGLSVPGTKAWGLGVFWLIIAAEEIWAWRHGAGKWFRRAWFRQEPLRRLRVDPAQPIAPHVEPEFAEQTAVSDLLASPDTSAHSITQQLTRSTAADKSDVLCGRLRMNFAPGQRQGNLHVAFCPPFKTTPELTAAQIEGPGVRIKIAQLLPYGARLELKLIVPSGESSCVLLRFSARAAP
jgi:hypothetical protein